MVEFLSVLVPIEINSANLTSSTVPENDYPVWSAGTTYAAGDFCINTTTHRVYESQAAGNLNKDPTSLNNQVGAVVWWTDFGPTNRYAMFDGEVNTQTTADTSLTVVIHPGGFNAFWVGALDADSFSLVVKDAPGGNVILSQSGDLEGSAPGDYDEYFFDDFAPQTDFIISNIDQYVDAELSFTISKTSGLVKCGVLTLGSMKRLGKTQRGAKAKPRTFSYIDTDKFGKTKIVRRKKTTDMTASAVVGLADARIAQAVLTEVLDVPALIVAAEGIDYSGLRNFGLISGEISYDSPQECLMTINVLGTI